MPMKSNVCSNCGESALVWEGYDGQEDSGTLRVCSTCGTVAEEGAPTYSEYQGGGGFGNSQEFRGYARSLPTKYVQYNHKSVGKGKLAGIQKTKEVASILGLTTAMTLEATDLFEKVYYQDTVLHKHIDNKLVIAGCCVYIVCRQHGWPILTKYVAEIVNCEHSQLVHWKIVITKLLGITLSSVDPEQLIPATCNKAGLSKTVEGLMCSIIQLCQKSWITDGRDPGSVLTAASYIAWQAEEPHVRRKTSMKKFCDICRVPFKMSYCKRMMEMKDMLCELAWQIPFVSKDEVMPANVAMYVKDVCSYKKQLLASALAKIRINSDITDSDLPAIETTDSTSSAMTPAQNAVAMREPLAVMVINKPVSGMRSPVHGQNTSTGLSRKRGYVTALVAPSYKRARENDMCQVSVPTKDVVIDRNLDAEEVTEEDIPDSDMWMYIKTPHEVTQQTSMMVHFKQKV